MPICPECEEWLTKEKVSREDEWDFTTNKPKLVRKAARCRICGCILLEKMM